MNDDFAPLPGMVPHHERLSRAAAMPVSPQRAELYRLTEALRRAIDSLMETKAPQDVLAGAADAAESLADVLVGEPRGRDYEGFAETAVAGDEMGHFEYSPLLGKANPLAPPLSFEIVGDEIHGRATFGSAYEGPPGCVHGGFIAATFDEMLGLAQGFSGAPGMTANLTVHYRSPTPLHVELRFVGRMSRREGRKIYTSGTLHAGDTLCAEAEGLFISIDIQRWAVLMSNRARDAANAAAQDSNEATNPSTASP